MSVHPVDEILPAPKLAALGLQHVLVMYANAVAVPLIVGGALHLPKDQIALLINADLFACGLATLIQTIGFGPVGIRLPIIMGVTAVAISPLVVIAGMPGVGLPGIYGAVLMAGVFGLLAAPFVKHALRFFPAVVTGTIIAMIGIVLMRVGVNWAGGGAGAADFGAPRYLGVAALVLAIILGVIKYATGFVQNLAVLIGIAAGYLLTIALGWPDFQGLADEPWLRVVLPLRFGLPEFYLVPCLTMCLVMTIVFIEATGMFLALGAMTGKPIGAEEITRGLRADAIGTIIGAVFTRFLMSPIRRTSVWSASPASLAAGSASPAASSCWRWDSCRSWPLSSLPCRLRCSAVLGSSCSAWWPPRASRSWRPSTFRASVTTCWWSRSRSASA
jgi:NCS2 family nucleobase:cation symporter-2